MDPPPDPAQVQFQGPEPLTEDAEPDEHRLLLGMVETVVPFAEPQAPLTALGLFALQVALLPAGEPPPLQLHFHCVEVSDASA